MPTEKQEKPRGVKTVYRTLASGEVKAYTYDLNDKRPDPRQQHAFKQIAQAYMASPDFKKLALKTRENHRDYIKIIEDELGWMTFAEVEGREARTDFYEVRDRYASTPAKADSLMDVLRRLLSWAGERGMLELNRASGIKRLRPRTQNRSELIWTAPLLKRLLAASEPDFQSVVRFALLTGLRRDDVASALWSQFDGEWLVIKPQKTKNSTGVVLHLPVFALTPLRDLLASLKRAAPTILTTERGKPWTGVNIYYRFADAKRDAGIADDLTFHDLRGTMDTRLQEAGCTEAETSAISGHAFGRNVPHLRGYTKRTRELSLNAFRKLDLYLKTLAENELENGGKKQPKHLEKADLK